MARYNSAPQVTEKYDSRRLLTKASVLGLLEDELYLFSSHCGLHNKYPILCEVPKKLYNVKSTKPFLCQVDQRYLPTVALLHRLSSVSTRDDHRQGPPHTPHKTMYRYLPRPAPSPPQTPQTKL